MVTVWEGSLTATRVASMVRSPSDEVKVLLGELMEAERKRKTGNEAFKDNILAVLP